MNEIRRCSRCILPETFAGITFYEEDVCNFCSSHKAVSMLGETKLRQILQTQKGKDYDCVVPISGGKDSTYVLYYAVNILKLKVIAVNYDSGFQSDLARENMENICRILNVPLVVKKADYENHTKMLREALRISEIAGTFFSVCENCENNIRTAAINVARRVKAPFILYGSSAFENPGRQPFTGMKGLIRKISKKSKRDVAKLIFHAVRLSFYSVRERIQMGLPIKYRFLSTSSVPFPKKGVKVIHFFDYIQWDSIDKAEFLEQEVGWKHPNGSESRFDCLLHCFENRRFLKECGSSEDGVNYSNMIRQNRIRREDALLRERILEQRVEGECLETIRKIGLKDYQMPKNLSKRGGSSPI